MRGRTQSRLSTDCVESSPSWFGTHCGRSSPQRTLLGWFLEQDGAMLGDGGDFARSGIYIGILHPIAITQPEGRVERKTNMPQPVQDVSRYRGL